MWSWGSRLCFSTLESLSPEPVIPGFTSISVFSRYICNKDGEKEEWRTPLQIRVPLLYKCVQCWHLWNWAGFHLSPCLLFCDNCSSPPWQSFLVLKFVHKPFSAISSMFITMNQSWHVPGAIDKTESLDGTQKTDLLCCYVCHLV